MTYFRASLTSLILLLWCQGHMMSGPTEQECSICREQKSYQRLVCQAEFVIHIEVTRIVRKHNKVKYRAEVLETFKPKPKLPETLIDNNNKVTVRTREQSSNCTVDLERNEKYIISGHILHRGDNTFLYMDECSSASYHITDEFPLTAQIRSNFKYMFQETVYCRSDCQVKFIHPNEFDKLSQDDIMEMKTAQKQCVASRDSMQCLNLLSLCYWRSSGYSAPNEMCAWVEVDESSVNSMSGCAGRLQDYIETPFAELYNWGMAGMVGFRDDIIPEVPEEDAVTTNNITASP